MLELVAGWFLGRNGQGQAVPRAWLHPAGHLRYRPLHAWAYVIGRGIGRASRNARR